MSYGIMLRRLKQEEDREARRAEGARAVATGRGVPRALPRGQTPTDIVLAALDERPRQPGRRAA